MVRFEGGVEAPLPHPLQIAQVFGGEDRLLSGGKSKEWGGVEVSSRRPQAAVRDTRAACPRRRLVKNIPAYSSDSLRRRAELAGW